MYLNTLLLSLFIPLILYAEESLFVTFENEDGKLFIDYLSSLKQSRLRKKLHKESGQQVY